MKYLKSQIYCLMVLTIMLLPLQSKALAAVAANAQIVNEATLYFNDGGGIKTATASVTVTVQLVSSVSNITGTGDQDTPYTGPDTPLQLGYVVTATSNGPETYNLSTSIYNSSNTSGGTTTDPAAFILGASVTTTGSTTTVINVPSDGASDGSVNGLEVGDTVVINGETRTITAISDAATGISTITLNTPLSSMPGAGVQLLEQKTVYVSVASGTVQTFGDLLVLDVNAKVTNGAGDSTTISQTASYNSGKAFLYKYVRNITNALANGAGTGAVSYDTAAGAGTVYYAGGVVGSPGDVLEYLLVAQSTGGGVLTGNRVEDKIPVEFVTLNTGTYAGGTKEIYHVDDTGTVKEWTIGADGDPAALIGNLLVIYIGTGSTAGTGGTISAGNKAFLTYQATINP